MSKNAREAAHLLQNDAKLRADHAQIVVALLRPSHAHRAPHRGELGIVGHEVAVLENTAPAASVVELEVARDHALALPALENRASLIADPDLAGCQNAEIFRHLGGDVGPDLDDDAAVRRAVDLDAEIVHWKSVRGASQTEVIGGSLLGRVHSDEGTACGRRVCEEGRLRLDHRVGRRHRFDRR